MKQRNHIKRFICIALILFLAASNIGTASSITTVYAQEPGNVTLETVTNISWKEGSTATAAWHAVEGANYYDVIVSVFFEDELLGSKTTGTDHTEIDLQSEINNVVGEKDYEQVNAKIQVRAVTRLSDGTSVVSEWTESDILVYPIKNFIKLEQPKNPMLTEDQIAIWDISSLNDIAYFHLTFVYEYGGIQHLNYTKDFTVEQGEYKDGKFSVSCEEAIKEMCKSCNYSSGEMNISFQVKACSDKSGYLNSDDSDFSSTLTIDDGAQKVATPKNPQIGKDGFMSWNIDSIDRVDSFYIFYEIHYDGMVQYASDEFAVSDGIYKDGVFTTNQLNKWKQLFDSVAYNRGSIQIGYSVKACTTQAGYADSSTSDNSSLYTHSDGSIQMETPTNLYLDETGTMSWDISSLDYVSDFRIHFIYEYEGVQHLGQEFICNVNRGSYKNGTYSVNMLDDWLGVFERNGYKANTIQIHYTVQTRTDDEHHYNSNMNNYSETLSFSYKPTVRAIHLAPQKPILHVGNTLSIGKTITPENAFYNTIHWFSSDQNVICVDQNGKITAVTPGNATLRASIENAYGRTVEGSADVTVYDIDSNIKDTHEKQEVTETAGDIIDDIANNTNPDLDHTDILQNNVDDVKQEIQDAIQDGNSFHTDIKAIQQHFNSYKNNWGQIQKAANQLNAQFAGAYNIEVEMYHKDKTGEEHHIGNITELENEVTFTFDLPTGMKQQQTDTSKKYVLVRVHKTTSGRTEYTPIDYDIHDNGTFTAKSDKYSDFIWLVTEDKGGSHKHTWNKGTVTKKATCTAKGQKKYTCTVAGCSTTKTEQIATNPNNHVSTKIINKKNATCTKAGYTGDKYCNNCKKTIAGKTIKSIGHTWNNGKVTKKPTETANGTKTYTCKTCGSKKTTSIPKTKSLKKNDVRKDDKKSGYFKVIDTKKKEVSFKTPVNKKSSAVTIPRTVKINHVTYKVIKIEDNAFKGNKKVTKVTIGSNVKTIGKNAFSGATKLKTVSIGKNVTTVGANAFKNCSSLTSITLPSKATKIGAYAFSGCKKLKTITIKSTKLTSKTVSKNAFKGISKTTVVKIPKKLTAYKRLLKNKGLSSKVRVKGY